MYPGGPVQVSARIYLARTAASGPYVGHAGVARSARVHRLPASRQPFRSAIRVVADGDALLAPAVTRRLIEEFATRPEPRSLAGLTEREREILGLIAQGLSNTEITQRLYLSMGTVKTHIGRLLAKLGARDRAQLVIAAYDAGLARRR
jgi:DNA-binding NarL/FixJ family response regulator